MNEIQVRCGLAIRVVNGSLVLVNYASRLQSYNDDMAGAYGPCIGEIVVPVAGIAVNFAPSMGADKPGWINLFNQDPVNFVTIGVKHTATDKFFPFGEILPGKGWPFYASRFLGQDYGSGGTGSVTDDQLFLIASDAPCSVLVETFPR